MRGRTRSRCARCRTCTRPPGVDRSERRSRRTPGGHARHARREPSTLPNPVMTASGTSGHGTELADVRRRWASSARSSSSRSRSSRGRATRRRGCTRSGPACSTASGLQGPGLAAWVARRSAGAGTTGRPGGREHLGPFGGGLRAGGRRWWRGGRLVGRGLVHRGARGQRELSQRGGPLAHVRPLGRGDRRGVLAATACGVPRWAKLSPNVPDLVEIAAGAVEGGADGLTLVNTLLGLALDTEIGPARPGRRRGRAVRGRRAPGGRAGRVGVPGRLSRAAHRRRGRRVLGPRRRGAVAGRRRRRPGGHRHLPRSPGAVEGAAPAGAVVRRPRHDVAWTSCASAGAAPAAGRAGATRRPTDRRPAARARLRSLHEEWRT